MSNQPYVFSAKVFNEAAEAIIVAELMVASGCKAAPCYVFLVKKTGEVVVAPIIWNDKDDLLLWEVNNPKSIGDIKALMFKSKGEPFCGDSLVEWYLKHRFDGVIEWNFNEGSLCGGVGGTPTTRVFKKSDGHCKSVLDSLVTDDDAVAIDEHSLRVLRAAEEGLFD